MATAATNVIDSNLSAGPSAVPSVIVVGGGLAGLSAARRAAQLGLGVVVLEKGRDDTYACNSRLTGGILHVARADPMGSSPAELVERISSVTFGSARPELAQFLADEAARACNWLRDEGCVFEQVENASGGWHERGLAPVGLETTWVEWSGKGADQLLARLTGALSASGGALRRGRLVDRLLRDDEAISGVEAMGPEGPETYRASAVILADGGFQGNAVLVRRHISPRPDEIVQRGAGTGGGTALALAESCGAQLIGLDSFYGHLLSRDALANPRLCPYPLLDPVASAGVLVDSVGHRFTDEGLGGVDMANKLARSDNPAGAWVICDTPIWQGVGSTSRRPPAPNPAIREHGGTVLEADSIQMLAERARLPRLAESLSLYNEAAKAGTPDSLRVSRSGVLAAIESPPFYAIPVCPGMTFTMGGPLVDTHARVVDESGQPIPGLYAVGSSAGGFDGGHDVGYVGGLVKAVVTGLAAAEHAASVVAGR